MTIPSADGILGHLSRLVAATELRTSTQVSALLALAESGQDTHEAQDALWRDMDVLNALRRQEWQVRAMLIETSRETP